MPVLPASARTHIMADYSIIIKAPGGVPIPVLVGSEDGQSFFTYGRTTETHKLKIDGMGGGHFSRSANKSGFVEFSVLHTSPVCAVFQNCIAIATAAGEIDTPGNFDIIITDNKQHDFLKLFKAKVEKPADGERGTEIAALKYKFIGVQLVLSEQGLNEDLI